MKYNVHLFAIVRVKVPPIEAPDHRTAMEQAEAATDLYSLFDRRAGDPEMEFAEAIEGLLVDEEGDEYYERSRYYDGAYRPR